MDCGWCEMVLRLVAISSAREGFARESALLAGAPALVVALGPVTSFLPNQFQG
jgi:hypothetical protein